MSLIWEVFAKETGHFHWQYSKVS